MVWHTEQRRVAELIPLSNNPRKLTSKQKEDLTASLTRFNLMSIPVINTDNTIVSGHQRMKIMTLLGRGEEVIDVRVPNRTLDEKEVREACIRENRNLGEWDWDSLMAMFPSEDLLAWGFDDAELGNVTARTPFMARETVEVVQETDKPGTSGYGEGGTGAGGPENDVKQAIKGQANKSVDGAVRLVQIYLTERDHGLFMVAVDKVQKRLGADNMSDAVFMAVKEAAEKGDGQA